MRLRRAAAEERNSLLRGGRIAEAGDDAFDLGDQAIDRHFCGIELYCSGGLSLRNVLGTIIGVRNHGGELVEFLTQGGAVAIDAPGFDGCG